MTTTPNNKQRPLLDPERIKFMKKVESKKCIFDELTKLLTKGQKEVTKHQVFDALIDREKLGSTSIGNGIAVPKAHLPMTNPRAAILVVKKGLKLGAADKQPIELFLAILIPDQLCEEYSLLLSTLNQKLILNGVPKTVLASKNPELLANYFEDILNSGSHADDSLTAQSAKSNQVNTAKEKETRNERQRTEDK